MVAPLYGNVHASEQGGKCSGNNPRRLMALSLLKRWIRLFATMWNGRVWMEGNAGG